MKILFKEYKQPLRLRFKGVVTSGGGGAVDSVNGRTGAVVLTKTDVALPNVDNTSDVNKPVSTAQQAALDLKEDKANKGQANGYASLDGTGKVPSAQLPSFVDDVLEYANLAAFPGTGTTGIIYVALDTNKTYRWSGSAYIEISPSDVNSVAGKTGNVTLVKGDVGLGNVDDTSDANKPVSTATQTALNAKLDASAYDDATQAETDAASSTTKYVSPAGLKTSKAGSKAVSVYAVEASTTLATGDGKAYFRIPTTLNGMNLVMCGIAVIAPSSSGLPTVQIARGRQASPTSAHTFADMLSTKLTIDVSEYDSSTATTPVVIDTANDDVLTGDLIRVDVDVAGTGVTGLIVTMTFQLP